mgnify:FL=1
MRRPLRVYHHHFTHPAVERAVVIPAMGLTPCMAKNEAWGLLSKLTKIDGLPDNGWTLAQQIDQQILIRQ